jgi:hypothetical protein
LPDSVIAAILDGREPAFELDDEALAHDFTRQLVRDHQIDDDTYASATKLLGERGVVDVVLLIGLYLTVCSIVNAFDAGVPTGSGCARHTRRHDVRDATPTSRRRHWTCDLWAMGSPDPGRLPPGPAGCRERGARPTRAPRAAGRTGIGPAR